MWPGGRMVEREEWSQGHRDELRAALEADHSARHAADPCAWAAKIL
eukprot:COSAG02_NODE_47138_length_343_cov_0.909836_1_plen_45_part_10